jgi:hypothetical protein
VLVLNVVREQIGGRSGCWENTVGGSRVVRYGEQEVVEEGVDIEGEGGLVWLGGSARLGDAWVRHGTDFCEIGDVALETAWFGFVGGDDAMDTVRSGNEALANGGE